MPTPARSLSRTPERFGTGFDDGVIASESANNATIGGALISMITMGIPGSIIDVILIAALTLHNIRPGPLLFQNEPQIVYGLMSSMMVANVLMLIIMVIGIRPLARLIDVPRQVLIPVLMLFCVVGTYAVNNRIFDVWVMLAFGLLGVGFHWTHLPIAPFVIGFILTPIAESNLRTALIAGEGNLSEFITRPFSAVFLLESTLVLFVPWLRARRSSAKTHGSL